MMLTAIAGPDRALALAPLVILSVATYVGTIATFLGLIAT
jgi:hypothetical protein